MIVTARSFIDQKVVTFVLPKTKAMELGFGDPVVFKNSFSLMYRMDLLAVTAYSDRKQPSILKKERKHRVTHTDLSYVKKLYSDMCYDRIVSSWPYGGKRDRRQNRD